MQRAESQTGKIGWYDEFGDRFLTFAAYDRQQRLYTMMWILGKLPFPPDSFYYNEIQ